MNLETGKSRSVRLALITDRIGGRGGAEIRIRSMVKQLSASKEVESITILSHDIPPADMIRNNAINHHLLIRDKGSKELIKTLEEAFGRYRWNIVQVHNVADNALLDSVI